MTSTLVFLLNLNFANLNIEFCGSSENIFEFGKLFAKNLVVSPK
jgi:hypothetical protein